MIRTRTSKRDHLIDTASDLFCRNGFRATGIDTLLRESGVAKRTLYNHFDSKDDLIVAALAKRNQEFMAKMRTAVARLVARQEGDPRIRQALAYFDGLHEWFSSDGFHGCAFINASAEYPDPGHPIHKACQQHKKMLIEVWKGMLCDLEPSDLDQVALQLALLADGAIVYAHTAADRDAAICAKNAARRLLESYLT